MLCSEENRAKEDGAAQKQERGRGSNQPESNGVESAVSTPTADIPAGRLVSRSQRVWLRETTGRFSGPGDQYLMLV